MGRPRILDEKLMQKLAKKLGKDDVAQVNKIVSRKASQLGISSEAALIILAKEYNIGTSTYQRSLGVAKQNEVRDALPSVFTSGQSGESNRGSGSKKSAQTRPAVSKRASLKLAVEYLIEDEELRSRCQDMLMASKNFDRAINQATLILEDRIRKKAQLPGRPVGENLVNQSFNEDMAKTVLRVEGNDPDDQRGFTQIMRGTVASLRNKTHHHIVDEFSREDAMRICGFVDVLLRVVDKATKVR